MSLGESIKLVRQKALYTQESFAKELHVALSTVNRWEMDKARPNISAMKNIKAFCVANNISYKEVESKWLGKHEED